MKKLYVLIILSAIVGPLGLNGMLPRPEKATMKSPKPEKAAMMSPKEMQKVCNGMSILLKNWNPYNEDQEVDSRGLSQGSIGNCLNLRCGSPGHAKALP